MREITSSSISRTVPKKLNNLTPRIKKEAKETLSITAAVDMKKSYSMHEKAYCTFSLEHLSYSGKATFSKATQLSTSATVKVCM